MLANKNVCTGCGSCAMICPCQCIEMDEDKEGFLYPEIDVSKCISCGLCEHACPILNETELKSVDGTQFYAAQNKNEAYRRESSSGGVFTDLALALLKNGGVICAVMYSDNYEVITGFVTEEKQLTDFRGAKYAQSNSGDSFKTIRTFLEKGNKVLFVGTPCQVAGLHSFLQKEYENLLLVDMVCHGVPSPLVWEKYVAERKQSDAADAELISINMRDKSSGWSRYGYSVRFEYSNGYVYSVRQDKDMYMKGFVENLYLRPSCSSCKFKGVERISDITIADYWGVWDQYPDFDDDRGTSLMMIHTKKGEQIWNSIQSNFRFITITEDEAVRCNPSAVYSSVASDKRDRFFEGLWNGESVSQLVKRCLVTPDNVNTSLLKRLWEKIIRRK